VDYAVCKPLHQSSAALLRTDFVARGQECFAQAAWVQRRTACTVPPRVATLLLSAWVVDLTLRAAAWLAALEVFG
jgi:hypothetical protein